MKKTKNKKVILVAGISGDIGSSYAKSIYGNEFSIVGCDMNSAPCDDSFFEQFFPVPPATQTDSYLKAIKEISEKVGVDLIVPISEPEIKIFHENRKIWSSWKRKVLINNELILDHFLDKLKTVEYLSSIGIKVPKTYFLAKYKDQLKFPMIIKPRSSCGSKNIWKVESNIDLEYFRKKDNGTYLIQEYLGFDAHEYTTGVFSDGNNISSVTFKRKLGLGGITIEADLVDSPQMDAMAQKLAVETKLIGSINIQTRLCGGDFIPFEINPRFSSTLNFRKQFGFSDCLWWPLNFL